MWSDGKNSASLYGPVPTDWSLAVSALYQPFGTIAELRRTENAPSRPGYAAFRLNWTVIGSLTSMLLTGVNSERHGEPVFSSSAVSMLYATSAPVRSWPLWNLTPLRRVKTKVVSFGVSHFSARAGMIWVFSS